VRYREGSPPFLRHAAVADTLPDGRLMEHRGLGHTKKLNAKAIGAALTEFLTDHDTAPRA